MIAQALAFAAGALAVVAAGRLLEGVASKRAGRAPRDPSRAPRLLRLLAALGAGAVRRATPHDLERRIAAAGRPGGIGARELLAAKLTSAILAAAPATLVGAAAPGRLGVLVVVAGPVAGFLVPDLWLRRAATRRATAARRQLPDLLELLRVTVESGTSLAAALGAVGRRSTGPLALEWRTAAREVELGVPVGEALVRMGERLPLPEVRALTSALDRTRRHGVPLGTTLSAQARDARLALRRKVQEDAAKAGPKIQLVVALLLVPSVLLLVAAALVSALLGGGTSDLGGF